MDIAILLSLLSTLVMGFLIVAVVAGIILYPCYVNVIKNKNSMLEAKSDIDVQFKKRYDLIPNVLTIAQKFMEHEKEIFEKKFRRS